MPIWINDNSTPRNLSSIFVDDNGTVRDLQKIWINDNGSVRLVFSKGVLSPADTTFYEFTVALESTLGDNVISAGPVSSSTKAEGVAGTWEVILAPGYSFGGTNTVVGSYDNRYTTRYLFTVQADGTSTALASSSYEQFKGGNFTVNYADPEAFSIVYSAPVGLAGFPHRAVWGNTNTGTPTNVFRWTVPAAVTSPVVSLIAGGGGGGSGSFYGGSNSSWGGGGGGGGGYSLNLSVVAGTTYTMAIGLGGAGGIMSWSGTNNGASGQATSVTGIASVAGGSGGIRGEDGIGPGTGGAGGSPNGASGGNASPDYDAGTGFNGANSGAGGAGGPGGTGDGSPQGGNGGGGGGGWDAGGGGGDGVNPYGRFSTRGGGGGGGAGEFSGGRGGDGYIQFTWS